MKGDEAIDRTKQGAARVIRLIRAVDADPRALAVVVVAAMAIVYRLPDSLPWFALTIATAIGLWPWPGHKLWLATGVAVLWATWSINAHIELMWPASNTGQVRQVSGRVTGLPQQYDRRTRFILVNEAGRRMRLSWYGDPPRILPGDCVMGRAKLETPHGSANPGLFDYEAWLWRNRIHATGYFKQAEMCSKPRVWTVDRVRAVLRHELRQTLGDDPMLGVIEALTIGAQGDITDAQWQALRRTGTTHLVSISGLHIGLIAGWLFFLARWLALRLRPGRSAEWLAVVTALIGATIYTALAGWALPTQRSLIMVAAALLGAVALRGVERSRLLALAALIVVAITPTAVISPGFWLSFGAVAWLLYLIRPTIGSRWRQALFVQVALVACLMPFTLWFFGQGSLVAPLVNAILIPAAAIFVPAVLIASVASWTMPVVGSALLQGVAWMLGTGWSALAWVAHLPAAAAHLTLPNLGALLLAVLGLIWLFAPRGIPARWLGLVLICPAILGWQPVGQRVTPGTFVLTMVDVGQGSANVVRTAHHTLIFDAGPAYDGGFDAGRLIVVPYLRLFGIDRIDALVLSHSDRDHAGGAGAIRQSMHVMMRRGALSPHPCRAGQQWHWDGVTFRFLYPNEEEAEHADSDNAGSCVLRIIAASGHRALLTGDIEAAAEHAIVARVSDLHADVLAVAHHGSATSSTPAFLDAVAPRYALLSSGWHNRWQFPARVVVERLQNRDAMIANTAIAGAVTVHVGDTIRLTRWRASRQRLWQRPRWNGPYNYVP